MDAITIIQQLGFPIASLIFAGWGLYRGVTWLGPNVFLPIVRRHMAFLDAVEGAITKQTGAWEQMADRMDRMDSKNK